MTEEERRLKEIEFTRQLKEGTLKFHLTDYKALYKTLTKKM
jgi:hypothetical protein